MHGVQSPEREIMAEVGRRVTALTTRPRDSLTFQDVHEALVPALTIWDSRRLELCQHDAAIWLEFALAAMGRRFAISDDLRRTLRRLLTPERDV